MNTEQMRAELARKYTPGFAKKLSDAQVTATYLRLKRKDKI